MRRRLALRRETLAELTRDDLTAVVGAASGLTCPVADCVRDLSERIGCFGTFNCPTYDC